MWRKLLHRILRELSISLIGRDRIKILHALSQINDGSAYGVTIHNTLLVTTGKDWAIGHVNTVLQDMEFDGLVWSQPFRSLHPNGRDGLQKKYYFLTNKGKDLLSKLKG